MQANKTIKLSYIFAAILIASALQVGCLVCFAKYGTDSTDTIAEEAETPDITLPELSELVTECTASMVREISRYALSR